METVDNTVVIYAGFWKRLLAYIVDFFVMLPVFAIFGFIIGALIGPIDDGSSRLLAILMVWPYYAFSESSSWQGTVGKKVLGLKVTDMNGNSITFGKASVRFLSKIISGLILGIGYFMAAFTARKQALHDIIADCLVVCR